jgi:hypothetical protein
MADNARDTPRLYGLLLREGKHDMEPSLARHCKADRLNPLFPIVHVPVSLPSAVHITRSPNTCITYSTDSL